MSTIESLSVPAMRTDILIAATVRDAQLAQSAFSRFRPYLVITPDSVPCGIEIGVYVWTQEALLLPPEVRMRIKGKLAPAMREDSVEEVYPAQLLDW